MSFISKENIEEKYNWVDVKPLAENMFDEFELQWVEDAWNLIMFNATVKEKNILPRQLDEVQKGDSIIWLLTLYQFYFDFKCVIEEETAYFDHDIGLSGFATYRSMDLIEKMNDNEESEKCITIYLWNDVFEELNKRLSRRKAPLQSFYDLENKHFLFCGEKYELIYNSEREIQDDSVAKHVLLEEIALRREYFTKGIFKTFNDDEPKIVEFLTCYRWVNEYSDYEKRKELIEGSFKFIRNTFQKEGNIGFKNYESYQDCKYDSVEEIDEEMIGKLQDLNSEYFEVSDYIYNYEYQILQWIYGGMQKL